MRHQTSTDRRGFTLTELLVVIAILLLISAATIPVALGVFGEQEISDAAGTVQAAFSLTRDTAVREGRPVGIRLLPDPVLNTPVERLASNRMLPLQSAPNYSQGTIFPIIAPGFDLDNDLSNDIWFDSNGDGVLNDLDVHKLAVVERKFIIPGLPDEPTSFYYNIRQGEKLKLNGSGTEYTIAGPIRTFTETGTAAGFIVNPERFINFNAPTTPTVDEGRSLPVAPYLLNFEALFLTNGRDDDGDGYVDESFDGIDNDSDGITDPGFNGLDDNANGMIDEPLELLIGRDLGAGIYSGTEFEQEVFIGRLPTANTPFDSFTIARRPLPQPGAREISLPANVVIDLTTSAFPRLLGTAAERSRVPIDPATGYVDFLIYPNGQIVPSTPYGNFAALADYPYYFLWLTERQDVFEPEPFDPAAAPLNQVQLPVPRDTPNYNLPRFLEGQRRMVVISPNSGHAAVSPIETFDGSGAGFPFASSANSQQGGGPAPL